MFLKKTITWTIYILLFCLPWQTRWIFGPAYINGIFFEYGTRALYGTGILFLSLVILLAVDYFWKQSWWRNRLDGDFRNLEWAFWLGGLGQGALGLWQFFTQQVSANKWLGLAEHRAYDLGAFVVEAGGERWLRAYGAFGSPNALGIYLAVVLVVGFMLYLSFYRWFIFDKKTILSDEKKIRRENFLWSTVLIIGQIIITAGLLVSFSRGAWLAVGAGMAVLFYFSEKANRRRLLKLFSHASLVVIIFIILFPQLFFTRLTGQGRLERTSVTERRTQAAESWQMARANISAGVGYGRYTQELVRRYPALPTYVYQPVHNVYLLILAEMGLPVFLAILALIFLITRLVYLSAPERLAFLAVWLVAGFFDHWLWTMFSGLLLSVVVLVVFCLFLAKK